MPRTRIEKQWRGSEAPTKLHFSSFITSAWSASNRYTTLYSCMQPEKRKRCQQKSFQTLSIKQNPISAK